MTPLQKILAQYRSVSQSEKEKGTYFEELIRTYFRNEPKYADLYSDVWLFADWAKEHGEIAKDTGIDLVAKTAGTEEYHAIQCKCYAEDYRVKKADIDSFFTASGKKPFTYRLIVTTTDDWSENAEHSLEGQTPPVSKITLHDLENSQIDWEKYAPSKPAALKEKKTLRKHQISALENVKLGLKTADRGKLIMACGTGKTFTSLKIAEELAGKNKRVLFLVPSLNLLSQTLTEWTQESSLPLHSFAVCSDVEVGKKKKQNKDEDIVETLAHELQYPATTDARRLALEMGKRHDADHMSVVFSTYHSIDCVSKAQNLHNMADFDLIVCDEAHRTTGATFGDDKESNFVKIHDAEFIRSAKRLYMTATPRIYGSMAKATAERDSITLASMDDEALFGKQLHLITFSEAVELKLLTDYKVLVLAINSDHVSDRIQDLLKDENNSLKVDDAARIIGCWKALSKQGVTEHLPGDEEPMRRAVAFCQVIEAQGGKAKTHKVSSKQIAGMFQQVVDAYQQQDDSDNDLICEAAHVDGSMNAGQKEEKLDWLKAEAPPNTCRILSNVRCLSEGVDVPALDAVLFLTPRNSQVDVVQSVGRVMRNAPGKQRGYVILPVVIPSGMEAHEALDDNKTYRVVWDVLQALRSHDDTFESFANKVEFDGQNKRKMEVISITDEVKKKSKKDPGGKKQPSGKGTHGIGEAQPGIPQEVQAEMQFQVTDLERALYAKLVKKCGSRNYWDDWAKDIAKIANTHISRITQIISNPENKKEAAAFAAFANELRDDLNDSITDAEVIEMLAQHLITKPVFDSLFKDYSFASHNPVSKAMQHTLDVLQEHRLEKEADTLEKFYASVSRKAKDTNTAEGKQKIVVELYDKFFRNAFPRMTERLGIVYTPVEVVDFIIHSVNDLLKQEFGQTLGSEGVHIIDPFTGTGTFITRLLQSGLITKEQLPHKYGKEIHANEIVLLAYYIAAINIEAVYHGIVGGKYQPFQGICLTDTFRLDEEDLVSELLANNSERRKRLQKLDWFYFDRRFNNCVYQMPKAFGKGNLENLLIATTGRGSSKEFSVLISKNVSDLEMIAKSQCFPLYLYEKTDSASDTELFSKSGGGEEGGYTRRDAITDAGLEHFRKAYGDAGKGITKEDLFYYIYGLLHSPEYRSRYADNLSKELPRIPAVKKFSDFMAFSKAGRELADWHLNYETSEMHPEIKVDTGKIAQKDLSAEDYRVVKMKFAKKKDPQTNKSVADKTTVIYNPRITLRNIPVEAYEYVVNGKPALEWVMERQCVKPDPASGIVNDANDWAIETMNNPAYPMELFLRVAKVSVETMRIVKGLPKLEID
eukprot:g4041.t1